MSPFPKAVTEKGVKTPAEHDRYPPQAHDPYESGRSRKAKPRQQGISPFESIVNRRGGI